MKQTGGPARESDLSSAGVSPSSAGVSPSRPHGHRGANLFGNNDSGARSVSGTPQYLSPPPKPALFTSQDPTSSSSTYGFISNGEPPRCSKNVGVCIEDEKRKHDIKDDDTSINIAVNGTRSATSKSPTRRETRLAMQIQQGFRKMKSRAIFKSKKSFVAVESSGTNGRGAIGAARSCSSPAGGPDEAGGPILLSGNVHHRFASKGSSLSFLVGSTQVGVSQKRKHPHPGIECLQNALHSPSRGENEDHPGNRKNLDRNIKSAEKIAPRRLGKENKQMSTPSKKVPPDAPFNIAAKTSIAQKEDIKASIPVSTSSPSPLVSSDKKTSKIFNKDGVKMNINIIMY